MTSDNSGRVPYAKVELTATADPANDRQDDGAASETTTPVGLEQARRQIAGGDRIDATRVADDGQLTWQTSLPKALEIVEKLKTMDRNDPAYAQTRDLGMAHFEVVLSQLPQVADTAETNLYAKGMKFQDVQKEKTQIHTELAQLGVPNADKLTGDAFDNLLLNTDNAQVGERLVHLKTLRELERLTTEQAGQAMTVKNLPYKVAMEAANYLSDHYQYGAARSQFAPDQLLTAYGILNAVTSPEMMAAGGQQQMKEVQQQQALQISVVPQDKNPIAALVAAQNPNATVEEKIAQAKRAEELARDLPPDYAKKQIEELTNKLKTASGPDAERLNAEIAQWKDIEHAPAMAQILQGQGLLAMKPPKFAEARDMLLKASNDSVAVNAFKDGRGQSLYNQALMLSMTDGDPTKVGQALTESGTLYQQAAEKAYKASETQDAEQKKKLLQEARDLGTQAMQKAAVVRQGLGGQDAEALNKQLKELEKKPEDKRTEEEKATIKLLQEARDYGALEGKIRLSIAAWDMARGDGNAAKEMMKDFQDQNPEFMATKDGAFNEQLKDLQQSAKELAEDQNRAADWERIKNDDRSWLNPGKLWDAGKNRGGAVVDFLQDNAKWVAFGVAVAAGAVISVGSAGTLAAPVAIALGVAGGALIGGAAGVALEATNGRRDFGESVAYIAPYAVGGAIAGATGGFALSTGGAGTVAATWGGKLTWGAGMGASSSFSTALGDVHQGYKRNNYDSWDQAASEVLAKTTIGAGIGVLTLPMGGMATGWANTAMGAGGRHMAIRGLAGLGAAGTAYGGATMVPNFYEGGGRMLQFPIQSAADKLTGRPADFIPRWQMKMVGYEDEQIDSMREYQEEQRRQGVVTPEAQPQPQPQRQIEAQPVQPQRQIEAQPVQPQPQPEAQRVSSGDPSKPFRYEDYIRDPNKSNE